jgi:glycosyltransferase involved in cell wall biosynthesis
MCSFPVVTVGLPFFNHAEFLDTAIQSVVNQTFADWELWLVDDGSTDNSLEIAYRWAASDSRIRVITDGNNRGLPARLNQIARLATGQSLARMDADDQMLPDRLTFHIGFLKDNPTVDVVGSAAWLIDETGQPVGVLSPTVPRTIIEVARRGCFVHPTMTGKTAWFRQNPYNETLRFVEDHDLWVRTFSTATFHNLPEILLNYRQPDRWQKHIGAMRELRGLVATWPLTRTERRQLSAYFWLKQMLFTAFNVLKISQKIVNGLRRGIEKDQNKAGERLLVQVFTVPVSLRFIEGQASFWHKRGFRLHVICSGETETRAFAKQEGIGHEIVPFHRPFSPISDLLCLIKLCLIFWRLRPAVVHGNTPKAGLLAMLAARLTGVRERVYELHGLPLETRRGLARAGFWLAEKLTCRLATRVVAVSPSLRVVALRERLVSPEKIVVPHRGSCNGVDALNRFNPAHSEASTTNLLQCNLRLSGRVLGFVGRLSADKGIAELTETWAILRRQFSDLQLLIIGLPECWSAEERQYLARFQADSRVRFTGWVGDVEKYLPLLNVLLLPTHREGMPTVLLEAAAMQIPMVANRVTGVTDAVLDTETGLLVDVCEPHAAIAFAEAVSYYLNNPNLARKHGQQARNRVLRDFRPEDVWAAKAALLQTPRP